MSLSSSGGPLRTLSTLDVVCLIIGTVIGAGIFKAPSVVAGQMDSALEFLLIWVVGGLISIAGALCYAELATSHPHPGGEYHYLSKAFGKRIAFFYAWARSTVIITGSIAILAITLGDYMTTIWPLGPYSNYLWAMLSIVGTSALNLLGIRESTRTQNALTVLEVLGIMAIVYAGFAQQGIASMDDLLARQDSHSHYGLAMVFVLLTFGGWSEVSYLSAEVKDGRRGMSRALVLGLVAVTTLYLLANLAYLNALGLQGMAQSKAVASDVFTLAFGKGSAMVFSVIVILSCLNSLNATMIFGARSNFALGQDFRTFAWLGHWHGSGNPRNSLIVQMLISLAVVMLAIVTHQGFETVVEFTAPVFWAFILLVGVALIVLRQREPDLHRPFRVPLYPWLPLAFIGVTGWMLWSSLVYTGLGAWVGAAVLVCGLIPLAWEAKRHGMRLPQGTAGRSSEA
jgi:basic amino acid/polyamine antiporter, APA family